MRYPPERTAMWLGDHLDRLGLTQAELAERAGFTAADISRYKSQKQRPRVEHLERFAEALEVDVLEVLIGLGAIDPDAVTTPVVTRKVNAKSSRVKWTRS